MTVITLTTVGFGEVKPLSTAGRLFTMGLILLGVGTLAYGLRTLGELILERDYLRQWRRRRIMRQVSDGKSCDCVRLDVLGKVWWKHCAREIHVCHHRKKSAQRRGLAAARHLRH
ncbi:MAG: two pore domain potassium channel family protein [Chloroflexi bacterium]|nr:two pore domain potassium channel family protein [Chloroflexota bacterium]